MSEQDPHVAAGVPWRTLFPVPLPEAVDTVGPEHAGPPPDEAADDAATRGQRQGQ